MQTTRQRKAPETGGVRRQLDRRVVVRSGEVHSTAVQLLHRVARRQRLSHRRRLNAAVQCVRVYGQDVAVRRAVVRPLAVSRLHRMPVFHLHRLLYHRRPLLLDTTAGALPSVENRTQGQLLKQLTCLRNVHITHLISAHLN